MRWPGGRRRRKSVPPTTIRRRANDRPGRTALGVAVFTFYLVLTIGGGQDVFGFYIDLQQVPLTYALRGLVIALPIVTGYLAWRVCLGLRDVPVDPPELPEGPADSATPPPSHYLPARARWAREESQSPDPAPVPAVHPARAALLSGAGAVLGFIAGRRSRASRTVVTVPAPPSAPHGGGDRR